METSSRHSASPRRGDEVDHGENSISSREWVSELKNAGSCRLCTCVKYMRILYLHNILFHRPWLSCLYTILK